MSKARKGMALSAAAVANLAVAGFAAAPAGATTHAPAATTHAIGAQSRGFVPRARAGARPDSGSGCNGNVCIGIKGSGLNVRSENQHFFDYSGCHLAAVSVIFGGKVEKRSQTTACYHDGYHMNFNKFLDGTYAHSVSICATFQNVPGKACLSIYSPNLGG
jgi:hypothetical protein